MDSEQHGVKDLLGETVRAFKAGMHGEEYENPYTGHEVEGDPHGPDNQDRERQLSELADLRASGTLTQEEYDQARARVDADIQGG